MQKRTSSKQDCWEKSHTLRCAATFTCEAMPILRSSLYPTSSTTKCGRAPHHSDPTMDSPTSDGGVHSRNTAMGLWATCVFICSTLFVGCSTSDGLNELRLQAASMYRNHSKQISKTHR